MKPVSGGSGDKLRDQEQSLYELGLRCAEFDETASDSTIPDYLTLIEGKLKNLEHTDVKVKIDDQIFNCHLVALKCYSKYFQCLDEICGYAETIELPGTDVTPRAFSVIYAWILADGATITRLNFVENLKAATFLKMDELVRQCWCCIDNKEIFNERTAFTLYMEAREQKFPLLQTIMTPRISKVFLTIVASKEFLELEFPSVRAILKSNNIAVNEETDVLYSAIRWLEYNFPDREKFLVDLLKCVRFGLLVPWMLIEFKKYPEEMKHIFGNKKTLELIDEAISYITIKKFRNGNPKDIKFTYLNPNEQMQRRLITDPMCKQQNFPSTTNIKQNYEKFISYLDMIKSCPNVHWQSLNYIE